MPKILAFPLPSLVLALGLATITATAIADERGGAERNERVVAAQGVANVALDLLGYISMRTAGSQDTAMRRCSKNVDEARNADRLGSRDMATKYWEVAARVCRVDALLACKNMSEVAPTEQCHQLRGLSF